jgi:hypothetical protein
MLKNVQQAFVLDKDEVFFSLFELNHLNFKFYLFYRIIKLKKYEDK